LCYDLLHTFSFARTALSLNMKQGGKSSGCRLLDLPIEIRLLIYQHTENKVLMDASIFGVRNRDHVEEHPLRLKQIHIGRAPPVSLLYTCSTIREEYVRNFSSCLEVQLFFVSIHGYGPPSDFEQVLDHLKHFKISDSLKTSMRNASTLHLHFVSSSTTFEFSE